VKLVAADIQATEPGSLGNPVGRTVPWTRPNHRAPNATCAEMAAHEPNTANRVPTPAAGWPEPVPDVRVTLLDAFDQLPVGVGLDATDQTT